MLKMKREKEKSFEKDSVKLKGTEVVGGHGIKIFVREGRGASVTV